MQVQFNDFHTKFVIVRAFVICCTNLFNENSPKNNATLDLDLIDFNKGII